MKFDCKTHTETLLLAFAAAVNAGAWLWVALGVPRSAFPVIAYYNVFWKQDLLGERPMIFAAPLLGALMLLINTCLMRSLKGGEHAFLRAAIAAGTVLLEGLVLAASGFVVAANT